MFVPSCQPTLSDKNIQPGKSGHVRMVASILMDSFNVEMFTYALFANDCYCTTGNSA
jgi:hypothetical protein